MSHAGKHGGPLAIDRIANTVPLLAPSAPAFALAHMVAHRRLSDGGVREFRQDATIQPTRGVPLLARRLANPEPINERRHRAQLRFAHSG